MILGDEFTRDAWQSGGSPHQRFGVIEVTLIETSSNQGAKSARLQRRELIQNKSKKYF